MSRAPWNNVLHPAVDAAERPLDTAPVAVGVRRMQKTEIRPHSPAGNWRPVWSMVYSPCKISWEMGTTVYPSCIIHSNIPGRASGVWRAALWNSTMLPGLTWDVTRRKMVSAS